jgi:hypothetical protein
MGNRRQLWLSEIPVTDGSPNAAEDPIALT